MPEENAYLPLADLPEELELAELAALLDYLRENAQRHTISELKEQALDAGYRGSVVERAIAEFEKEPRPEPPEEKPKKLPVPAMPPPKVPAFLEQLAEDAPAEPSPAPPQPPWWARRVPPGLAFLVIGINAVVFSMLFNGHGDAALLFYCLEFGFALFLSYLGQVQSESVTPPLQQQEQIAPSVQVASPVPTLAHEAPAEEQAPQRDWEKAHTRRR